VARARNIKPGFFRNADLVDLSFEARLLFIGLWTIADREGRLEDRPKQIKMELFPADNMDCDAMLAQLAAINMIERYEHDGKRYIQVVSFAKHQNPHRDEKASTLPDRDGNVAATKEAPIKHSASTVQARCKQQDDTVAIGLIPESCSLIPESRILTPEPMTKEEKPARAPRKPSHPKPDDVSQQVWDDWLELRRKKSAPVTATVLAEARTEAVKAGLAFERFLAIWCARGSQGLQADWLRPHERGSPSTTDANAEAARILGFRPPETINA
jgi:hypothetical protein